MTPPVVTYTLELSADEFAWLRVAVIGIADHVSWEHGTTIKNDVQVYDPRQYCGKESIYNAAAAVFEAVYYER